MSCAMEEELTAYLDRELAPDQATRVEEHLVGCAECRRTHALLQGTLAQLSTLPAFEPSVAMRREVLKKVDALPKPWRQRLSAYLRPGYVLPAGGVIAAAIVAVVVTQHHRPALRPSGVNPGDLELAMNYEVVENYEVLGVDSPEDLDVVEHLQELEATP